MRGIAVLNTVYVALTICLLEVKLKVLFDTQNNN